MNNLILLTRLRLKLFFQSGRWLSVSSALDSEQEEVKFESQSLRDDRNLLPLHLLRLQRSR